MLKRCAHKNPKTFLAGYRSPLLRLSAGACLVLCGVLSCISREFSPGQDEQSLDANEAPKVTDSENRKQTELQVTRFSGALIHEADNKQPIFLKKTLDSIVNADDPKQQLEVAEDSSAALPSLGRPAEGFSSAIGAEVYQNRRRSEALTSDKDSQTRTQVPTEQLVELKKKWLLLASFGGPQGLFQTARHLKEYFLLRGKDLKDKRPTSELPPQLVQGALEQIGFWSRNARAGTARESESLSAGEKIFQRNRALLLLEFISKVQGQDSSKFQKLNQFLASLEDTQSDGLLLWVRTHVIVNPAEQSDWFLALGPFSVLSYSFAHISEVTNTSFTFTAVTYHFLFGVHSWTQSETAALLDKWCVKPARKEPLYESTCDDVMAFHKKMNNASLGIFAEKGLATEFEVKGYSPIFVHKEKIEKASLNPNMYKQLQEDVSHFSL